MKKCKNCISFLCMVIVFVLAGHALVSGTENGTFSGRVIDVSQNPVARVEVFVYNTANTRRPADYIAAPTNENGEFRVTLPPGTYWTVARLRHSEQRYGPLLPGDKHSGAPLEIEIDPGDNAEEEFVVADLEETSQLVVKVDTSFIKIEGLLLTKKDLPVENAYAIVSRNPMMKKIPDYVSPWSDKSGKYTLFLSPGTYYFGLAKEFPPALKSIKLKKVIVDSKTKNINIVIEE